MHCLQCDNGDCLACCPCPFFKPSHHARKIKLGNMVTFRSHHTLQASNVAGKRLWCTGEVEVDNMHIILESCFLVLFCALSLGYGHARSEATCHRLTNTFSDLTRL